MFSKIKIIIDPEHQNEFLKERILEFFQISGFKIIAKLCQEQMIIDASKESD